jgi:transposase
MTRITTIGLDLAKSVFQVHGVDAAGNVVVARQIKRKELLAYFAKLPPCLVGMEACGSAHYWAREIAKLGHTVRLMPPKYVKAYVKRGKTDAGDAAAICEAVTRPSMTFVPVKTIEQQGLSMLHGARALLIGQRTQTVNALRGHLSELGIVAERGLIGLAELAEIVRSESDTRLPVMAKGSLMILLNHIETTSAEIAKLDDALRKENKASELGTRLQTVPSIGPVIASALRARVTDPRLFENGRHLSAWIGIVPENDSTGGKVRQKGLSRKGDRYLRALLVSGAMALVQHARRRPDKYVWVANLLGRMSAKQAAIAIANKTARIAWSIMVKGGVYEAGHRAPQYRAEACAAAGQGLANG